MIGNGTLGKGKEDLPGGEIIRFKESQKLWGRGKFYKKWSLKRKGKEIRELETFKNFRIPCQKAVHIRGYFSCGWKYKKEKGTTGTTISRSMLLSGLNRSQGFSLSK